MLWIKIINNVYSLPFFPHVLLKSGFLRLNSSLKSGMKPHSSTLSFQWIKLIFFKNVKSSMFSLPHLQASQRQYPSCSTSAPDISIPGNVWKGNNLLIYCTNLGLLGGPWYKGPSCSLVIFFRVFYKVYSAENYRKIRLTSIMSKPFFFRFKL